MHATATLESRTILPLQMPAPTLRRPRPAKRAAAPMAPFWAEPAYAAFAAAGNAIDEIPSDELPENVRRLVDLAFDMAWDVESIRANPARCHEQATCAKLQESAFDMETLLVAALHFPDEALDAQPRASIHAALNILGKLTDMLVCGAVGVPALLAAIAPPAARAAATGTGSIGSLAS